MFTEPDEVNVPRKAELYLSNAALPGSSGGKGFELTALTAMLGVIGRLPGLTRAPGPMGYMKKIPVADGSKFCMTVEQHSTQPFPSSMKVIWDAK